MNEAKHLTMSEKALLGCLAAGAGEPVDYRTLACEGLGFLDPGRAGELLVRQHIHNLRLKLPPGSIVTDHANAGKRGGYRLAGEMLSRMVRFAAEGAS